MARPTVGRCRPESAREAARIWLKNPENRKKAQEVWRKWDADPKNRHAKARRRAMEIFGREIARLVAPPRVANCAICDDEFVLNTAGKPRRYCEACVRRFSRSTRECPGCGRTMPLKKSQLTCRHCGTLWGRNRDGKI